MEPGHSDTAMTAQPAAPTTPATRDPRTAVGKDTPERSAAATWKATTSTVFRPISTGMLHGGTTPVTEIHRGIPTASSEECRPSTDVVTIIDGMPRSKAACQPEVLGAASGRRLTAPPRRRATISPASRKLPALTNGEAARKEPGAAASRIADAPAPRAMPALPNDRIMARPRARSRAPNASPISDMNGAPHEKWSSE